MAIETIEEIYGVSTWKGLSLAKGHVGEKICAQSLRDALPDFALRPFGEPPNTNPRLRCIWRRPFRDDPYERPVAVVSDQYDLLQHRVLATWLTDNLKAAGLEEAGAEITMTEFGERVRITIPLDNETYDFSGDLLEPDLFRPELELTNSVDRSSAFHVVLRWRRLVCLNGMFTTEEDRLRSIHRIDLSRTGMVRDFIKDRLSARPDIVAALRSWKLRKTDKETAQSWCEQWLREKSGWTVENCARLWWILETGYDGAVNAPSGRIVKWPLSAYKVGQHCQVPGGNYPVRTAYDVAQLLTWITSKQRTVEMQIEGTEAVPKLMAEFLKFRKAR